MFPGNFFGSRFFPDNYWMKAGAATVYGHTLIIGTPASASDGVTESGTSDGAKEGGGSA